MTTYNYAMGSAEHTSEQARQGEDVRLVVDTIPTVAWSARSDGSADFFNQRWLDYTGDHSKQESVNSRRSCIVGFGDRRVHHVGRIALRACAHHGTPVVGAQRTFRFLGTGGGGPWRRGANGSSARNRTGPSVVTNLEGKRPLDQVEDVIALGMRDNEFSRRII